MGRDWICWADPYRGDRVNNVLEDKDKFDMDDMINLQIDYFSIPSKQIIELSNGHIKNNIEHYEKLLKWNNVFR